MEMAMKSFTAVVAIINHPQNHWITIQLNPKNKILEVFDSMAPKHVEHQIQQIQKVRSPPWSATISDVHNDK
jgi:sentrin-specific protease 1